MGEVKRVSIRVARKHSNTKLYFPPEYETSLPFPVTTSFVCAAPSPVNGGGWEASAHPSRHDMCDTTLVAVNAAVRGDVRGGQVCGVSVRLQGGFEPPQTTRKRRRPGGGQKTYGFRSGRHRCYSGFEFLLLLVCFFFFLIFARTFVVGLG